MAEVGNCVIYERDIDEADADRIHQENIRYGCENERRLVLVGRTGNGKSATGNSILRKDHFLCQDSPNPVTEICRRGENDMDNLKIVVVDTPGLFDTKNIPHKERHKEIMKCIAVSAPGPHAVLYVLSLRNKLTQEEIDTFLDMITIFGEHLFKYLIILFTSKDELDEHNLPLDKYIEEMPDFFQEVLMRCDKRTVAFNNNFEKNSLQNLKQVNELFSVIENMNVQNHQTYFSNAMLKTVEYFLQKQMDKLYKEEWEKNPNMSEPEIKKALRKTIRENVVRDEIPSCEQESWCNIL